MGVDRVFKKYAENMPYGDDVKSVDIHGDQIAAIGKGYVSSLVKMFDKSMESGQKDMATHFERAVRSIAKQFNNLRGVKEEFMLNYGGGTEGKNIFSNFTDTRWEKAFFSENGTIGFNNAMKLILSAPIEGEMVSKETEDITQDWVLKEGEGEFMKLLADANEERNNFGKKLSFDADWAVDRLLTTNWKSFLSDKIGGKYFLHEYLKDNQDNFANLNLDPQSFNPEWDNRLHAFYANRLKQAHDPNLQSTQEADAADLLMAKLNPLKNLGQV